MTARQALSLGTFLIATSIVWACRSASAAPAGERLVRIAELEIDPQQLAPYKAALREEIETALRVEPGVLALCAVSLKDHPEQIRLFETYKDEASYRSHLQSPHFKKYKALTQTMVRSLHLIETEPILLGSKPM